jgi:hypothetical protein
MDVQTTDRRSEHTLEGILDQRVARGLVDVGFPWLGVWVHASAHDSRARVEQLAAYAPQLGDGLAGVGRDLGATLDHCLEQLGSHPTGGRFRVSDDGLAVVDELVVGPDQQQLLLDAERKGRS